MKTRGRGGGLWCAHNLIGKVHFFACDDHCTWLIWSPQWVHYRNVSSICQRDPALFLLRYIDLNWFLAYIYKSKFEMYMSGRFPNILECHFKNLKIYSLWLQREQAQFSFFHLDLLLYSCEFLKFSNPFICWNVGSWHFRHTYTLSGLALWSNKANSLEHEWCILLALLLSSKRVVPLPLRNGNVFCCMLPMHAVQKPTF